MVLTVTEDTPADMLAGSMELLVQLPHDHLHTQRLTVLRRYIYKNYSIKHNNTLVNNISLIQNKIQERNLFLALY